MKRTLLIAGIALLVLSAILLTTGVVQFIIPPTFQSVARISVQPDTNEQSIPGRIDPRWIQTEMEMLQSKMVLNQVIKNLELNKEWGEKYKQGTLPIEVTYGLLRNSLEIRQTRNTQLVEIRVCSDDPTEAAAIANRIATVYSDQRGTSKRELGPSGTREKNESLIIKDGIVQIIEAAEPNYRPVKPHPLMKILVPVAGLVAGISGVILLMLAVMMKDTTRKPPPLP